VLVLDDTHRLTHPATTALLAALVEHQPHTLHLVLAGRADPPLPLARLRASGQLHEIRAVDLRFSPDETTALLRALTGLSLTAAQVAPLCARTEGWAAGLQLAALTLQGAERPAERQRRVQRHASLCARLLRRRGAGPAVAGDPAVFAHHGHPRAHVRGAV